MEWLSYYVGLSHAPEQRASDIYAARDRNLSVTRAARPGRLMRPALQLLLDSSKLLGEDQALGLFNELSELDREGAFSMAFATHRDGWSMASFCNCIGIKYPVVFILKTLESHAVIGAYIRTPLGPPNLEFKGDSSSFIFKLSGKSDLTIFRPSEEDHDRDSTSYQILQEGTRTEYAYLCREYIAFGGSRAYGTNAIRVFNDLALGSSGPSDTYRNEQSLVPEEIDIAFRIADIEVYCGYSS